MEEELRRIVESEAQMATERERAADVVAEDSKEVI